MSKKINSAFEDLEKLDKKSVEFLIKAITENNLPGFDYLEFKQSFQALKQMDMTEKTAMKSAYTTGSTVGLTKSKLISSAEHYKKVLFTEKQQFDTALQKQIAQRVHGKKEEKETLTKKIATYQAKIQELETEILKYQEKLTKADSEIEAAKSKIEETRDKFEKTFDALLGQIDQDVALIKEIL
ncbi:MAG: hypothetical protein OEM26_15490 [Saprospiraceae bacterium]|jgi:chromosome segregation ATPase|nr:hypothetical protein [Saprospiraceae bacterium]